MCVFVCVCVCVCVCMCACVCHRCTSYNNHQTIEGEGLKTRGQFHQPTGARQKSSGSHSFAPFSFTNNITPNFEITHNFYAIFSVLNACKFSINLVLQKLLIKRWRNWPLKRCFMRVGVCVCVYFCYGVAATSWP